MEVKDLSPEAEKQFYKNRIDVVRMMMKYLREYLNNEVEEFCNVIMRSPEQFKNSSYKELKEVLDLINQKGTPRQKVLSDLYKKVVEVMCPDNEQAIKLYLENWSKLGLEDLTLVQDFLNRNHMFSEESKSHLGLIRDFDIVFWDSEQGFDQESLQQASEKYIKDASERDNPAIFNPDYDTARRSKEARDTIAEREFVRAKFMCALGGKYREKAFEVCNELVNILPRESLPFKIMIFLHISKAPSEKIFNLAKLLCDQGFGRKNDFVTEVIEKVIEVVCAIDIQDETMKRDFFAKLIHNKTDSYSAKAERIKALSTCQKGRYKDMALNECYEVLKRVGIERDKNNDFIVTKTIKKFFKERRRVRVNNRNMKFVEIPALLETIFDKKQDALQIYTQLLTNDHLMSFFSIDDLSRIREKLKVKSIGYKPIEIINGFVEPLKKELDNLRKEFDAASPDIKRDFRCYIMSIERLQKCVNAFSWNKSMTQQLEGAVRNFDAIYRELSNNQGVDTFEGSMEIKSAVKTLEEIITILGYKPGFSEEILFK